MPVGLVGFGGIVFTDDVLTDQPTFRHSSDELQLLEDRWKSLDFAQQQLLIRSFGEYRIRKGGRGAERLVILPANAAA